jgi:hypothetical protein
MAGQFATQINTDTSSSSKTDSKSPFKAGIDSSKRTSVLQSSHPLSKTDTHCSKRTESPGFVAQINGFVAQIPASVA